jgi:hypothetical protein
MNDFDDTALRAALAPARNLEPSDDEVARAIERARRGRTTRRPGPLVLALLAAMLLSGGAYAVPATRAAIDDISGLFGAWVSGDEDQAPGRPLRAEDEAPSWVRDQGGRLIAKTDGVPLYVTRTASGDGTLLGFSLGGEGTSISVSDTIEGWHRRFDEHAVEVLGTLPARPTDEGKRFPLLGVTARSVDRVELHYASGPPLVANGVDGGFVLMADAARPLREIVVYTPGGQELERTDVSRLAGGP